MPVNTRARARRVRPDEQGRQGPAPELPAEGSQRERPWSGRRRRLKRQRGGTAHEARERRTRPSSEQTGLPRNWKQLQRQERRSQAIRAQTPGEEDSNGEVTSERTANSFSPEPMSIEDGSQAEQEDIEDDSQAEQEDIEDDSEEKEEDVEDGTVWRPPLAIGRSLGENLSRLQFAYRRVAQWEAILEHNKHCDPEALQGIQDYLRRSRKELWTLRVNEETTTPINELESTKKHAISQRIQILERALKTSRFSEEIINITRALQGYKTGEIQYWDKWTLIWNNHVVDFCPTYASFCVDRLERLKRYAKKYGEGWLWYEAPLAGDNETSGMMGDATAMRATCSDLQNQMYGMGCWPVTMGFKRVRCYVTGRPDSGRKKKARRADEEEEEQEKRTPGSRKAKSQTMSNVEIEDDPPAPSVYFDLILDSGATFPVLYEQDFRAIGINPETYAAQTTTRVKMITNKDEFRLYELRVSVTDKDCLSLVIPTQPVWPLEYPELGGIIPVLMLPKGSQASSSQVEPADGDLSKLRKSRNWVSGCSRLSGVLPFLACYTTTVPGSKMIWMGEDRRDVLGPNKFPGQMRFGAKIDDKELARLREEAETDQPPGIRFEQVCKNGGRLVDEDGRFGTSTLTRCDHAGNEIVSYEVDPWMWTRDKQKRQSKKQKR